MAIDDECDVCGRTIALHSHGCPQAFIQQEPEQSVEEMLNRQDGIVTEVRRTKQLLGAIQCEPITSRFQGLKDPRDLIPHTTAIEMPENPTPEQVEHFIHNACYCSVFGKTHVRTTYCKAERSPEHVAVKNDEDKLQYGLLPITALEAIVQVLTYGAKKYEPRNWERGMSWNRMFGALFRHLMAFWRGETKDQESGFPHLAHAGCCLLFLLQYSLIDIYRIHDDRGTNDTNSGTGRTESDGGGCSGDVEQDGGGVS